KDQVALIRADRALSYAYEQNMLAKRDLVAQGEWAIQEKKLDHAQRFFDDALHLDPKDPEARAGRDVTEKLKNGQLTRQDIEAELRKAEANVVRIQRNEKAGGKVQSVRIDVVRLNEQQPA